MRQHDRPPNGLIYYRARYFDPQKGRFLQTDPVGYSADMNLYTYVGNDPVDRTDPLGMYGMDDQMWDQNAQMVMQMTPQQRATYAVTMGLALVPGAYEVGGILAAGPLLSAGISGEITSAKGGSATDIGNSFVKGGVVAGATELTGGGALATMGVAGATDFTVGTGLDLATSGNANLLDNAEDAFGSVLGAGAGSVAGKLLGSSKAGAGFGSAIGRALVKKGTSAAVKNVLKSVIPHQQSGSGRSQNFGQTIRMQGTRICPKDSSGQQQNSC
jgi:RHS repeat-associated protein